MMKKYLLLFLVSCLGGAIYAQTFNQAKELFNAGKYEEAKPMFQKLLKQSPNNANYNYMYGACCFETGEHATAEEFIKKATARNVTDAFRYLAELQAEQYLFDDAVAGLEKYITLQQKKKVDTETAEIRLEQIKNAARMFKGTEQITVIDSFVVNKEALLSAYKIGQESGVIDTYNHYFEKENEPGCMLYQTELKNKRYFALAKEDSLNLYSQDRLADEWGKATPLKGLYPGNKNYPYVLSDGITLYYASDGEGSIGGYDIFVTRYNSETNRYLRPENIGMPFNSPANDYMYVVDEFNNLGWFASDRYQPEGKVCVYVFIPNNARETFNYENTDPETVRSAAMLQHIASTWKDEAAVRAARQRLTMVTYQQPKQQQKHDFEFIIDDISTYYTLNDFKSPQAKRLFEQWQQGLKDFNKLSQALDEKRMQYHQGNLNRKQNLAPEITDMEQRAEKMETELTEMEINIRNIEKNFISK